MSCKYVSGGGGREKNVHVKVTLCINQIFSMTYVDELNSVNL